MLRSFGPVAKIFADALRRAGRVWNIVHVMTPNPAVAEASMAFYGALMHGPSPLSRARREMLATLVSKTIGCVY